MNGTGYLDPKHHQHLWIMDVPASYEPKAAPRQLTSGNFDEREPAFTPDGKNILFHTDRNPEPYYDLPKSEIMSVLAAGGAAHSLATVHLGGLLGGMGEMTLSPDGKRLAFVAAVEQPVRSYSQPDMWVLDLDTKSEPLNLTAKYDYDVGSGVGGDNRAPRGAGRSPSHWTNDGSHIVDVVAKEGRAVLVSIDAKTGEVTELTRGNQAVEDFAVSADGGTIVVDISTPTMLDELYVLGKDGSQRQLTQINQALFSELNLTDPEEIWYTSFDGKKIQAWLQKPPHFDPSKKYPLILNIHGGPHSAYGWVF